MNRTFWKGKRVFLTGHTGFKGAWMKLWLEDMGAVVTGYSLPNDIKNYTDLCDAMTASDPEIIIHMAAQTLVKYSYDFPIETFDTNVQGTSNILSTIFSHALNVRAVLVITTDKVYKNKETGLYFVETDELGGYDPYSTSKICAELVTECYRNSYYNPKDYGIKHNIAIATARAGNVIGGGDWAKDRLIPDIIRAKYSNVPLVVRNPKSIRPWQHVLDVVEGYLTLCEALYSDPSDYYAGAWNFGPIGVEFTVEDILNYFKIDYIYEKSDQHEAQVLHLDCGKVVRELGWNPMSIETALALTADWYKIFYTKKEDISLKQIHLYEKGFYND